MTIKLTNAHQHIVSGIPHSRFSQRIIEGFGGFEALKEYFSRNLFFFLSKNWSEFNFFLHFSRSSISSNMTKA